MPHISEMSSQDDESYGVDSYDYESDGELDIAADVKLTQCTAEARTQICGPRSCLGTYRPVIQENLRVEFDAEIAGEHTTPTREVDEQAGRAP